jgi:Tfp pilus assembly protein PilN
MTKINLLPPEKIKARKPPGERSYLWLVIVLPLIAAVAIGVWWFSLNSEVSRKKEALDEAKKELAEVEAKNQQLEQYRLREEEISSIEAVVVTALQDRVYWARIMNNIAIMCPSDVWVTSLAGDSDSGVVTFSVVALQCPNRDYCGYGIYPHYPDYRPVAGWLDRMAQIEEFGSVWLSSASPVFNGTTCNSEGLATTEMLRGNRWYEDPYCVGTCLGQRTSTGQYTCFLGDWTVEFQSEATLDMEAARVSGGAGATEVEGDGTTEVEGDGTSESEAVEE